MLPDPYLSDLMKTHRFSIVKMETVGGGRAAWTRSVAGGLAFDSAGRWREVALRMRRDMVCEQCGREFGYTFQVLSGGTVSRGNRTLDPSSLVATLEQQLRRRVHCPFCDAPQRNVRRAYLKREFYHSLIGLTAVGGTIVGSMGLSAGGYMVAGGWGLVTGLGLSVALVLKLTRWMLARLLDNKLST
jgi:ribosomal protein L37AE/L43A